MANAFLEQLLAVEAMKKKKGEPSWRKYYRPPALPDPTQPPWMKGKPYPQDQTGPGGQGAGTGQDGGMGGGGFQMQGSYSGTEPRDAYMAGGKFMGGTPPIGLMLDGKMHFPGMGGGNPTPPAVTPPQVNTPGQPGPKPPMTGNPMIPGGGLNGPGHLQPPMAPPGGQPPNLNQLPPGMNPMLAGIPMAPGALQKILMGG